MILTAQSQLDLLVIARGYQPKRLYGVREDRTVVLEPFPEILIRIEGGLPELPEGYELRVSLAPKERPRDGRKFTSPYTGTTDLDSWLRPTNTSKVFNDQGEAAISVAGEGRCALRISLGRSSSHNTFSILGLQREEIAVRSSAGQQVFEIQIPAERLQRALERGAKH